MIKILLTIFLSFILVGCSNKDSITNTEENSSHTYQQISMAEAADYMSNHDGYVLLDVRTVEEFHEKHIPNAINVPNETIGNSEIPELPDKEQVILVYCRSGNRSKLASQKLAELGYKNIIEIGGINDWTGEIVTE